MRKLPVFLLIVFPIFINAQIITSFAGTGVNHFSGDGGLATSAGIPDPTGGIFDKYGNYYFADAGSNRIRKIDTLGIISTVAGNGFGGSSGDGLQATAARLNTPDCVKIDTFGNMIIAESSGNRIRKVDIFTGIISTIAGTGTGGYSGDGLLATNAMIYDPQDVAIDKMGNIYIADGYNYVVRKINPSGIITTYAGTGTSGSFGDGGPATAAELGVPTGLTTDDTGNLFIADIIVNRVRKVNTLGIITNIAGNGTASYIGDGIPATDAQMNPGRVAFDSFYNLYIADFYNYRVYKIDGSGIIHSIAGTGVGGFGGMGGPATAAPLDYPDGVALDACNNLYIPLADSNRILKVTYNPTCDPYHAGPLGINEISNTVISIYPNPATTTITINSPNKISHITISNLLGQSEYSHAYDAEKVEINIGNLPPGMYLLELIEEDGEKVVRKVLKE